MIACIIIECLIALICISNHVFSCLVSMLSHGIYKLVADEPSSGLQALFVTSTSIHPFCDIAIYDIHVLTNLKRPYHGFLLLNLYVSRVNRANIIDLRTLVVLASPLLHFLIFFIVMFVVPLVPPLFKVIATILCLLMTILV